MKEYFSLENNNKEGFFGFFTQKKSVPGLPGPTGPVGEDGNDNNILSEDVLKGVVQKLKEKNIISDNYIGDFEQSRGDQGIQGLRGLEGDIGLPGIDGIAGERGESGDKGEKGETGKLGIEGNKGLKGEDGLKGKYGVVVSKVTQNIPESGLIHLSNNDTISINLPQGDEGPRGPRGLDGLTGTQASSDNSEDDDYFINEQKKLIRSYLLPGVTFTNDNVGINETNPKSKLHIRGDMQNSGNILIKGKDLILDSKRNDTERISILSHESNDKLKIREIDGINIGNYASIKDDNLFINNLKNENNTNIEGNLIIDNNLYITDKLKSNKITTNKLKSKNKICIEDICLTQEDFMRALSK